MRLIPCSAAGLAGAAVVLLVSAGCSASQAGAPSGGRLLRVTVRDFRITAPKRVSSGEVRLSVRNKGPVGHELIVVRLRGFRLPFRRDGLTLDEEALEPAIAGALEPGLPGGLRELRVHLSPGRYVLFCNMSGHYLGGMHANLVVR
jgi:uncharacterized cupredoxin-like copper-binding protein